MSNNGTHFNSRRMFLNVLILFSLLLFIHLSTWAKVNAGPRRYCVL